MSQWINLFALDQVPVLGSRLVKTADYNIAVFRSSDDQVYAVLDSCPHKQGPLSQGIMHGHTVTCPLHNLKIDLKTGNAIAPDEGCTRQFLVKVENGDVYLQL